ncbi:MAG: integrase family protein [Alphaproteobacteria bacterium]|nr:integrase family protein [Alphaproteobacteria bacterium]
MNRKPIVAKPIKFSPRTFKELSDGTNAAVEGYDGLRIIVSGNLRTWTYRYRSPVDGKVKQTKLGAWPDMTWDDAKSEWLRARESRAAGIDVGAVKRAKRASAEAPATYTVQRLSIDYLASIERTRSPSSLRAVKAMFKRLLEPIAALDASAVTRSTAYGLIEGVSDRPELARKLKAELAQAWDYAIDSGNLVGQVENWWSVVWRRKLKSAGHMRGGEKTDVKRVLTPLEIAAVLLWFPTQPKPLAGVLTLTLTTGARSGEVVQMRGNQVTEDDGVLWWTLPKAKTKNAKVKGATDYRVPLVGRAAAIVSALKLEHKSGYLFPGSKGGHVTQGAIGEALSRRMPYHKQYVASGLTVTHWAAHDLRRTCRTMLATLGCPNDIGEVILGHVIAGVAGVYNRHAYDEEKVVWLSKLSDELDRLCAADR